MATSKTLTPTNVTISIPQMTDRPDASVFSNCVDKTVDAVNTLNSNLATINIISDITWSGISIDTSNSYFVRNNKIFDLQIISNGSISITDNTLIGTIGTGAYTPIMTCCFPIFVYSNGTLINGSVWVQSNGKITYFGDSISSKKIRFKCMWVS